MHHDPMETMEPPRKGKIAISRLNRRTPAPSKTRNANREERVGRACKTCRKRKVRCSGDVPTCKSCEATRSFCVYEQKRRDRLKEASNLNHTLATLLRDLQKRVGDDDKQKIDSVLNNVEDDIVSPASPPSVLSSTKRTHSFDAYDTAATTEHGEAHVTASAGSNEDLDYLDEDLMRTRQSRETGYIGQNSEVQWLRSVQRQTEHAGAEPHNQVFGPPGVGPNATSARMAAMHERKNTLRQDSREGSMKHITDSSFYLDSSSLDVDIMVDPYEFPDPDVAENLFKCYIDTVHSTIPLVSPTFEDQFRRYLSSRRSTGGFLVPDKWRAQLNLIFAIGAKYSHSINADWAGDERDHLIYMTRALQLLGLGNTIMFISGPDLELVQATGALAFYFLVIGHVSRAWIMIGVSIRLALSLGLHLRNEDPGTGLSRKATLQEAWWSLHSVECLVNSMTGRPPVIAYEDCTVPFPYGSVEGNQVKRGSQANAVPGIRSGQTSGRSSMSSTWKPTMSLDGHRVGHIKGTLLLQKALLSLYSPRTAAKSWEFIQVKIKELLHDLEEWAGTSLVREQRRGHRKDAENFDRDQYLLKIDYWSLKVLIARPCLCRLDGRIRNESQASHNFNAKMSRVCVESALEMARLFPDEPDLNFMFMNGPWWALVHVIMQAMAVLLLELAYQGGNLNDDEQHLIEHIAKLIRWLRALQQNDPMAANAHKIVRKILKSCAPSLKNQASILLAGDTRPNPQRDESLHHSESKNRDRHGLDHNNMYSTAMQDNTIHPDHLQYTQEPMHTWSDYSSNNIDPTWPQNLASSSLFGNHFHTSFDQGAPLVDLNNIWTHQSTGDNTTAMDTMFQNETLGDDPSELDYSSTYPTTQDFSGSQDDVTRSSFGGFID